MAGKMMSGSSFVSGLPSLQLTYPLKIDPWKRLETIIFRGCVSFRECNFWHLSKWKGFVLGPFVNSKHSTSPKMTSFSCVPFGCWSYPFIFSEFWNRLQETNHLWKDDVNIYFQLLWTKISWTIWDLTHGFGAQQFDDESREAKAFVESIGFLLHWLWVTQKWSNEYNDVKW